MHRCGGKVERDGRMEGAAEVEGMKRTGIQDGLKGELGGGGVVGV